MKNLAMMALLMIAGNIAAAAPNPLDRDLFQAVAQDNQERVQELLGQGASVHSTNILGLTPLHFGLTRNQNLSVQMVELLLENGADPNTQSSLSGETSLHSAASDGRLEIVEKLLDYGADNQIEDKQRKRPAQLADDAGHNAIVELLETGRSVKAAGKGR